MQKINVAMASMATTGHYSIYVALLQGPVDGPGIADALCIIHHDQDYILRGIKYLKKLRLRTAGHIRYMGHRLRVAPNLPVKDNRP